jgi:hypothetical protein
MGVLLLMCLVAVGCNPNVKVTGTVTYSDSGDPVMFGTVVFSGGEEEGRGTIKEGKYSIGRINDGDGIPKGTYTVSSNSPKLPPPPPMVILPGMAPPPEQREREVYYTKEPKTVEVKRSMTCDFQVERGSPPNM